MSRTETSRARARFISPGARIVRVRHPFLRTSRRSALALARPVEQVEESPSFGFVTGHPTFGEAGVHGQLPDVEEAERLEAGFADGEMSGDKAKAQSFFELFDWPRQTGS